MVAPVLAAIPIAPAVIVPALAKTTVAALIPTLFASVAVILPALSTRAVTAKMPTVPPEMVPGAALVTMALLPDIDAAAACARQNGAGVVHRHVFAGADA